MPDTATVAAEKSAALNFHDMRNRLLAEAHARPYTPLDTPVLATRIAAIGGEKGGEADRHHMVSLCRRYQAPEPGEGAKWCALDAGGWRLRWERHTEISSWTFYRPLSESYVPAFEETALDLVPKDWLAAMPGRVLVAAHVALLREQQLAAKWQSGDDISVAVVDGLAEIHTDFRPAGDNFTRFAVIQPQADATLAGRVVQQLLEIETYRLMALLAFPVADEAANELNRLEAEAAEAANLVAQEGGIEADRRILNRLAKLAGEAQALAGRTGYRFAAGRAYYGIVLERIHQLREQRIDGRPTIGDFMERRHAPAMRTCAAVAERQQAVIEHISRTTQLLSTRVEVEAETTNANLLASMDRRANMQLRLQQTVEGLSVAAISYYAIGLINYVIKALNKTLPWLDPTIATGIAAPLVIGAIWMLLARLRRKMMAEEGGVE